MGTIPSVYYKLTTKTNYLILPKIPIQNNYYSRYLRTQHFHLQDI